ncbi:MAG: DUF1295 domain-containing protein [Candidatus Pacebacteria bacterium]|nr:DUF1295 domain-containing protein [Candidatus Paceibacterota bacterium]
MLLILASVIYKLSILAFVQNKKGLITNGIYKFSRNPMYLALFLVFIAFALMAWQAEPKIGMAILIIFLIKIPIVH